VGVDVGVAECTACCLSFVLDIPVIKVQNIEKGVVVVKGKQQRRAKKILLGNSEVDDTLD
jgi:hypothetical protein